MTEVEALHTRAARPADFPAIWELLLRAGLVRQDDHDAVASRFEPLLLHPAAATVVAETPAGAICGFAFVAFHPDLLGYGRAWLVHLATADDPGRYEVAAVLVHAAADVARSRWRVGGLHAGAGDPWTPLSSELGFQPLGHALWLPLDLGAAVTSGR